MELTLSNKELKIAQEGILPPEKRMNYDQLRQLQELSSSQHQKSTNNEISKPIMSR